MVEQGRGDHKPRVDGPAYDPPKGVPRSVIKPIVEVVEPFLSQKASRAEVEVPVSGEVESKQAGKVKCGVLQPAVVT